MAVAPGYRHWIPLPYGAFGEALRDPLGFQMRAQQRLGDVVRFRNGPFLVHFLYHPDHVRRVLQDRQKSYLRSWQYRLLQQLFGDNLVVSEGSYWLRQRRLAQGAFHRDRLTTYVDAMVDTTNSLLDCWREKEAAGDEFDVGAEMTRLALGIAGRTFFGQDISRDADVVGSAFRVVATSLEQRLNKPFTTPPLWAPTAANRRFKQARRSLNEIILSLVRERRREEGDRGDLLSMLIEARDEESGARMTDEQLRCELLTFLIAGHETTATALTWTWYLLAAHAEIRRRVRSEAEAVLGGRPPTPADVPQLGYTRRVIEESMRLYPPIWIVSREAVEQDEIDGYRIPARSTIFLSQYVTHRHPDIWENPDTFDPDRFIPERAAQRPRGAYFPFLAGPHQCIGNEFAMQEMCVIVAMVLQQFDVQRHDGPAIEPQASLTLRPRTPVKISLRRIDRAAACRV